MYKLYKLGLILFFSLVFLSSCTKNLPDVGGTSAQKVANEWWCRILVGNVDVGGGHYKIMTYNDSQNQDSIWVDDLKHLYGFKSKAKVDYTNLTFSSTGSTNLYFDPTHPANFPKSVNLANGKVILNGGKSKTGNVTDSIYMEAKFSDDPSTTYIISGTARTRFSEDDY